MKDLKHIKRFNESEENLNISDVSESKIKDIINEFVETENHRINTSRIFRTNKQIEDYIKKLSDVENVKVSLSYERNILCIEAKGFRKNLDSFSNRLEFGIKTLGDF
jgi:hypothetical protein